MRGDNLLISNFDRWCSQGDRCVSVVYIRERCGYTPVDGGYSKRVVVEGDRERLRDAAREVFEYARHRGIPVQVNNPHVRGDIEAGIIDATGVRVMGAPGTVQPERGRVTQESPGTFYGGPGYVTVWYEDGPECPICGRPRVWRETDAGLICGTGEDCGRRMDPVDPCWSCRETLDRIGRR